MSQYNSYTYIQECIFQPEFLLIALIHRLGNELGVDPEAILATSHGRRSIDTLALYDESKANWECKSIPRLAHQRIS